MELVKGYKFFSEQECEQLKEYCDEKEREFEKLKSSSNQSPKGQKGSVIPITQRHHSRYNFFYDNSQYIHRLITCIKSVFPELEFPIAVQSWVNVYRKGQGIKWHSHAGKNGHSFSANIFLGGPKTPGIYYSVDPENIFNIENEVGSMHLFPNNLNHMVPKNETKKKRYTVGITIHAHPAIDKTLIHGGALNSNNRETIILTDIG
ncbi:MAG: 2OG-Fe(II) oxygenase family protein [Acidiferrobacterales bacterium]|nr:2OG-Fe(II) oxygenase family protein [Acidiferrobacterales bacterium]